MRTRRAIFMSKVHDISAPKMILGVCWGARAWLLAIPCQAWLHIYFSDIFRYTLPFVFDYA